ncbi:MULTISPECIES: hypothetical protein [unclassified Streptomyces]|uniref:hypothetical protein n=1 Tax=Streptomyces TaxID=1883 RepID=UPI0001C1982F|nr:MULTISPECIES: hypothetical protein [unclassified Streptomyces]AEN09726.1 hypothetical protein SACTE_1818 [Streptomyces sp. SirexAA-E]MYR66308.1 hypothetical protein [Streptomyces sp. SID4939]MYS02817.1 hypothetical protein [Streptomyces sp. SID4940]MYT64416.1 hypothetical protein [Streptomyces sp. SID8357]MYT87229.1 hypothetical protein [Streptomyces sp. SID8360]
MNQPNHGGAGCLLAAAGAATATLAWAPHARVSVTGGFEQSRRDLGVLYVDLPLIALGGALLPLLVWALALRTLGRPWPALVVAVVALGLGVWALTSWWEPYRQPEFLGGPSWGGAPG